MNCEDHVPVHLCNDDLSVFNDAFTSPSTSTSFTSMQEEEVHTNFEDEKEQEEIDGCFEEDEKAKKRRRKAADDSYACSQSDVLSQQQQPPDDALPVPVQALSLSNTCDDPVQVPADDEDEQMEEVGLSVLFPEVTVLMRPACEFNSATLMCPRDSDLRCLYCVRHFCGFHLST